MVDFGSSFPNPGSGSPCRVRSGQRPHYDTHRLRPYAKLRPHSSPQVTHPDKLPRLRDLLRSRLSWHSAQDSFSASTPPRDRQRGKATSISPQPAAQAAASHQSGLLVVQPEIRVRLVPKYIPGIGWMNGSTLTFAAGQHEPSRDRDHNHFWPGDAMGNGDVNQLRRPAGSRSEHIMFAIVSLPILVTCRSREGIPSSGCLGLPRLSALPKFHSPDEPSNSPPPLLVVPAPSTYVVVHPRCGIKLVTVPLHFIPISRPT
ncbi:hypothetical protein F5144DRAFT_132210 [Chaetomium tenue]|uniref:Uncharacterized protein n=1 Tax=Chaetomium tenue TaxID=1854479 RepID=A0ACB7PIK2_9PEZI|nr:hypothetical protein F5144DRAFT_132210 [Chaetomium globosum]